MHHEPEKDSSAGAAHVPAAPSTPALDAAARRRFLLAGTVGNILEWYDFAVYGYFAYVMADRFFPASDPNTSLIGAFGAFAAGFLMRPFGGIVFGHIGDRYGRRAALTLSVLAMAIPTFLIGLLPDYHQIGPAAAVLLVLLRMVQGLSVGGEYTTSIVFLVEGAAPEHRGRAASFSSLGANAGVLLGSAVGALTTTLLPPEAVAGWGWRLPFLIGLGVGVAGLFIRRHLPEVELPHLDHSPLREAFRSQKSTMLQVAGFNLLTAVGFYLIFVYLVTYFRDVVHVHASLALDINTLNMVLLMFVILAGATLSDRIGRKPVLLFAELGVLVLAWPLFWLLHHPHPWCLFLGQLGFTLVLGMYLGTGPVTMAEAFPTRVRCTALSLGYNLTMGLVGGTTPLLATWLIGFRHDDLAPAFLLMAAAGISATVTLTLRETHKEPLA